MVPLAMVIDVFLYLDKILKTYVKYVVPVSDMDDVPIKDLYIKKDAFKGVRVPESIVVKIEYLH